MVIGVLGGTGTAGRGVAAELRRRGHEAIAPSPTTPPAGAGPHRAVDVASGAGLGDAMAGLDAVGEVLGPKGPGDAVDRAMRVAREAGASHWVSLSVVGAGSVPGSRYHRDMAHREDVVRAAEVPWSIVRATQFHSLLGTVFAAAARRGVLPLLRVPVQPVDGRDMAVALADRVESATSGAIEEIAGPRIERLDELALSWAWANDLRRLRLRVPIAGRALRAVRDGALVSRDARRGEIAFVDWLRVHTGPGRAVGAAAGPEHGP